MESLAPFEPPTPLSSRRKTPIPFLAKSSAITQNSLCPKSSESLFCCPEPEIKITTGTCFLFLG